MIIRGVHFILIVMPNHQNNYKLSNHKQTISSVRQPGGVLLVLTLNGALCVHFYHMEKIMPTFGKVKIVCKCFAKEVQNCFE